MYKKILKNIDSFFYISKYFLKANIEIPNKFYKNILNNIHLINTYDMIEYIKKLISLIKNNKNINDKYLKIVSFYKDKSFSLDIAKAFINKNKDVPQIIINSILEDAQITYNFVQFLKNIKKNNLIIDKMYKIINNNFT